ncbi:MAG: transcriptional regulator [Paenibacillus sp.]|jgi:LCP family protein required for cell wall assembly|nr:transcriptional regulator [Paenibacillus sp.]
MKGADRMARKIKWSLLSIALLLLVVTGYYTYAFVNFSNNIQSKPEGSKFFSNISTQSISKTGETYNPPKWEGKQRVNVLLLGGDSRGMKKNEVPRSDTLIVASIDPTTKKAYLFSILRDTYVKIPGSGEDRINAALALGGPNLAMKTVGDLLGIPVQYYVYTDFKGFIALVDAIDGIDINVEKDMKYSDAEDGHEYDINLKKGMQHLDGKMALQYVRFRHDALSDFARTERQRNFMQAVAQKMQSTSSILKLPRILSSVDPYIETNLSTTDMLKLGSLGYEAKTEGMVSQQIPPAELLIEKRVGGAEVLSVNREKLQAYIQALFDGTDPEDAVKKAPVVKETLKNSGPVPIKTSAGIKSEDSAASTAPAAGIKGSGTSPFPAAGVKAGEVNASPATGVKPGGTGTAPATGTKTGKPDPAPTAGGSNPGNTDTAPAAGAKPGGTSTDSAATGKPGGTTTTPADNGKAGNGGTTPVTDGKNNGSGTAPGNGTKPAGTSTAPVAGTKQSGSTTSPGTGTKATGTGSGTAPSPEVKPGGSSASTSPAADVKSSGTSSSSASGVNSGKLPAAD